MTLLFAVHVLEKTLSFLTLARKLDPNLKGTAAYISQHDVHIVEMTVRETLAFSARCQGVGSRYELLRVFFTKIKEYFSGKKTLKSLLDWYSNMLKVLFWPCTDSLSELSRREIAANMKPDMKVTASEGQEANQMMTEFVLKEMKCCVVYLVDKGRVV
ncbi:pleiotropic drug resistance protein 1-like isoform X1 [Cajanus cajan]|uniref:pleiotropic drug resistance protein 1-like isoform X1 n=1 Tax=Cajanus cajan TaxID=3821 RepID=UPI0010FB799A|nr:pleiotropic drug resistance protein 1-like isoform X1 [Cajanus cajan]